MLEAIGFTDAEKAMLSSTFRLTSRRRFHYDDSVTLAGRVDIFLVNVDNADALKQLEKRNAGRYCPAVLIGRAVTDSPWPQIVRPIHWMRLFDQLDAQMEAALIERTRRGDADPPWDGHTLRRAQDRHGGLVKPAETASMESVLVVDDSATVRAFMRAKLAPFRFDVDFAESGEKAIDLAQAKAYTCIFLDIMMPGMDGYQVCKRIKSSEATRGSAVVMLSSKSSAIDKFRGSWAGCDAYLGKPVSENDLLATIARFLPSARRIAKSVMTA